LILGKFKQSGRQATRWAPPVFATPARSKASPSRPRSEV
jgi:hypothetical protein